MSAAPDTATTPRDDAAARGVRRRRRPWRRRLVALAISTAVSVVILAAGLEIGARRFFPSPFAAEGELVGMYQNAAEAGSVRTVPGWQGEFTVEGRTVPVQLNSLGLRSPEIGARQPGELRVLFLGDSFTFGYGVAAEEAFPDVVRGRLAERLGRPVVTGNAGVPGYGTVEEARCLRRIGPAFDADVVVCAIYLGNDFVDDQVVTKYVEGGFSMTGEWATLLRRSLRARLMLHSRAWMRAEILLMESGSRWALHPAPTAEEEQAFAGFPKRSGPNQCHAGLFMDVIDIDTSWEPEHPEPVVPRILWTVEGSLRTIRDAAAPARVLVVLLPSWWHVLEDERVKDLEKMGLDPAQYAAGLVQQRVITVCEGLGLPVLDVTPAIKSLPDPASVFLAENRHLNPEGHRLVADLIAQQIDALVR